MYRLNVWWWLRLDVFNVRHNQRPSFVCDRCVVFSLFLNTDLSVLSLWTAYCLHTGDGHDRNARSLSDGRLSSLVCLVFRLSSLLGLGRSRCHHAGHSSGSSEHARHAHTATHLGHALSKLQATTCFGIHLILFFLLVLGCILLLSDVGFFDRSCGCTRCLHGSSGGLSRVAVNVILLGNVSSSGHVCVVGIAVHFIDNSR
jgi:hypothetical protein